MRAEKRVAVDGKKCCHRCNEWKDLSLFFSRPLKTKMGYTSYCKACYKIITAAYRRGHSGGAQRATAPESHVEGERGCPSCQNLLPICDFYPDKSKSDGLSSWCRSCTIVGTRARNKQMTKEQRRNATLKKKYGISLADYNKMMVDQAWTCLTCPADLRVEKPHLDHDHVSGVVRGILCGGCNISLGLVKDNPRTLINLSNYVIRHLNVANGSGLSGQQWAIQ